MKSSDVRRKTAGWLNGSRKWHFHLLINLVFGALVAVQWLSLDRYWTETLQPRLLLNAETQSAALARSQVVVLVETLTNTDTERLQSALFSTVQEILIVKDLNTGNSMMAGVSLTLDDAELGMPPGSLNLKDGDMACDGCFFHSEALIDRNGILLGVADFAIRGDYYQLMSGEMKARLFRESAVVLVLLVFVWGTMLVVFHRLHNAKRLIEASDRAKTRFLANVTHELRTPLNGILGYTQLFKDDPVLMNQHGKGINTVDRCADHLLQLINDILEFSRADEDRIRISPQELNLVSFLQVLVEISTMNARSRRLTFQHDFPVQLPAQVWVDDKRLRQVLLNLLGNAIKFTLEGSVRFSIDILEQKQNRICLRFQVQDTGIGIAEQDMNAIFVPFQQLENAITRSEGSGLGLSISQKLVRLMGSRLKVSSVSGEGSRFWFDMTLPVLGQEMVSTQLVEDSTLSATDEPELESGQPDKAMLDALKTAAQTHNILALKALQNELQGQPEMGVFNRQLSDFIDQYQFKPLLAWLESLNQSD